MSPPTPCASGPRGSAPRRWRPLSRRHRTVDGLDLEIPAGQKVLLVAHGTLIRFLLSDEASYITGECYAATGGSGTGG